tara:strand:- start:25 stop:540 length:516 start_codon:yes stop_codon:yes gene_type:complete
MKSVFLGTRLEALMEVSLKTKVIKVITTKKSYIDKYANKNKFKITYVDKKNKMKIFNFIKNTEAKLIFSSGFPYKIPKKYIDFKKIFINSHPSLLPKYKGLTPVRDALKQNEKEMGVSVHYMTENLDDGKLIKQQKIFVKKNQSIDNIYKILFSIVEPQVIKSAINQITKK